MTAAGFARISPPTVSNSSDNLKYLFEIQTLFYGIVLYLYVTGQVDAMWFMVLCAAVAAIA